MSDDPPAPDRQPFMPEGAASPASALPPSPTSRPEPAKLWNGHLSAECSLFFNGAPACPACLRHRLVEPDRDDDAEHLLDGEDLFDDEEDAFGED